MWKKFLELLIFKNIFKNLLSWEIFLKIVKIILV